MIQFNMVERGIEVGLEQYLFSLRGPGKLMPLFASIRKIHSIFRSASS